MSRYTGPVCRLCRAEGAKLFLKGDRCYTEKCGLTKRNSKPGQHGTRRGKMSEYGLRLREKQKLRRFYGINETQFSTIYKKATGMSGQTGHNFLQLLERRLDNVVYRLGLGVSRSQARQLVCHGHFTVNGRSLTSPARSSRSEMSSPLPKAAATSRRSSRTPKRQQAAAFPRGLNLIRKQCQAR